MANKKTSYIDAQGNKQIGYIIDGSTYSDEAGTTPVGKGSIVEAGGQQWVKGVGADGGSMLYGDYLKSQGMSATDYLDPNGQKKTGYIKDGATYADILGTTPVSVGSVVTAGGQQWLKEENGSVPFTGGEQPKKATPTSYVDALGNLQTGYIIDGKTYKDQVGTMPVEPGSMVSAGGQQWVKGEDGEGQSAADYLKELGAASGSGENIYSALLKELEDKDTGSGGNVYADYLKELEAKAAGSGNGENIYGDYLKKLEEKSADIGSGEDVFEGYLAQLKEKAGQEGNSEALEQMLAEVQSARDKAIASNDKVYAAQLEKTMQGIAAQIDALNQGYKDVNTQLYRDYMTQKKNLPQLLAAQGITGGLSESSLISLEAGYQGSLAENERARLDAVKEIELAGKDAELELAIEKARAEASAGDVAAERRLAVLQMLQEQRNFETQRADSLDDKQLSALLAMLDQRNIEDQRGDNLDALYLGVLDAMQSQKNYEQQRADSLDDKRLAILDAIQGQKNYETQRGDNRDALYFNVLQAMQGQKNYESEIADEKAERDYDRLKDSSSTLYADTLAKAEVLASIGDFSGYRKLGYSDEEVAALEAAWKAANGGRYAPVYAPVSGGGGTDAVAGTPNPVDVSGGTIVISGIGEVDASTAEQLEESGAIVLVGIDDKGDPVYEVAPKRNPGFNYPTRM